MDRINNRRRFLFHPVHPVDPCSSVPQEHRQEIREIRGHFILVAASPRWDFPERFELGLAFSVSLS
jgi:hypothetical protein